MPDVKRTFKIITEQRILEDAPSPEPNFPLRHWSIEIVVIHQETKDEVAAECFQKVIYKLHPSFGDQQEQEKENPPFRIEEDGWGEFVMKIWLTDLAGKEHVISHDLNFSQERYEVKQVINFKNPKGDLAAALRASGLVPGDAGGDLPNGKRARRISGVGGADGETGKKRKRTDTRGIDMDALAKNLQELGEDDLLQVVQMVHAHGTADSWTKNDVDEGEFHVDLYTLPENLIKMLWDFSNEKRRVRPLHFLTKEHGRIIRSGDMRLTGPDDCACYDMVRAVGTMQRAHLAGAGMQGCAMAFEHEDAWRVDVKMGPRLA